MNVEQLKALQLRPMGRGHRRHSGSFAPLISLVTLVLATAPARGDEAAASQPPASASAEELLGYVLAAVQQEREKLQCGSYVAKGVKEDGIEGDSEFPHYSGDVSIFSAFDYGRDLYRFDRRETQLFTDGTAAEPRRVTLRMHYVRTAEGSIHCVYGWRGETPEQAVVRIWPTRHAVSEYLQPMDVRTLGLGLWTDIHSLAPLGRVVEGMQKRSLQSVVRQGSGMWQVVQRIRHPDGNVSQFTFWLDEARGFSPIRMEVRFVGELAKVFPEPIEETTVTWTQINDVWVPDTLDILQRSPSLKRRRVSSYRLRLDWQNVNNPLSSDIFTIEAFGLPEGTEVYDHRLGKPVLLRVIKAKKQPQWAVPSEATKDEGGNRAVILILANVVVFGVLAAAWFLTRAVRRRSHEA